MLTLFVTSSHFRQAALYRDEHLATLGDHGRGAAGHSVTQPINLYPVHWRKIGGNWPGRTAGHIVASRAWRGDRLCCRTRNVTHRLAELDLGSLCRTRPHVAVSSADALSSADGDRRCLCHPPSPGEYRSAFGGHGGAIGRPGTGLKGDAAIGCQQRYPKLHHPHALSPPA